MTCGPDSPGWMQPFKAVFCYAIMKGRGARMIYRRWRRSRRMRAGLLEATSAGAGFWLLAIAGPAALDPVGAAATQQSQPHLVGASPDGVCAERHRPIY